MVKMKTEEYAILLDDLDRAREEAIIPLEVESKLPDDDEDYGKEDDSSEQDQVDRKEQDEKIQQERERDHV